MTNDGLDIDKALNELKDLENDSIKDLSGLLPVETKTPIWAFFVPAIMGLVIIALIGGMLYQSNTIVAPPMQNTSSLDLAVMQNLTQQAQNMNKEITQLKVENEALSKVQNTTVIGPANNAELKKLTEQLEQERKTSRDMIDTISTLQARLENATNQQLAQTANGGTTVVYQTTPGTQYTDFSTTQPIVKLVTNSIFSKLKESTVEVRDETIGYKELINLKELTPTFTSDSSIDKDFNNELSLANERGSIEYVVRFDSPINFADIDADNTLKFSLLGKDMEISHLKTNGFTLSSGDERELGKGDTIDVEGVSINLVDTTDNKAVFRINNEIVILTQGQSKTIGTLSIKLNDVVNANDIRIAQILVGKSINKEVLGGDKYEDNTNFVWTIKNSGTTLTEIGIKYDKRNWDKDEVVLKENQEFNFLDYFKIKPSWSNDPKYIGFSIDLDRFGANSIPAVRVRSNDGNKILVNAVLVNELWLKDNNLFYMDSANHEITTTGNASIVAGDLDLQISTSTGLVRIGSYSFITDGTKLGATKNQDEANEIMYGSNQIGTRQRVMSPEGIKLTKNENDERINLDIPTRRLDLRLAFVG